ncbi:MAG: hypothetical protein OEY01_16690, partial [Desulfobulbaceae bacterium]|nr:hypothetical protein [Desulfobulbaceae bacterium]
MVKNTGDIFLLFSHFLEKCAVPYVVVGNTESYPERIGSDIDIVVPATDFKKIHMLVQKFAGEYCLQIVQCLQHEYCAFYFVLVFHGKGKNNGSVALDICSNYYRQGSPYIPARMLLQGRKHATNSHGQNKGFFVPAPAMEFLYYMVKKISKGPINNEQLTHLHDQFQQNPKHCIENMQLFWPAPVLVDVKLAIQNKDLQRLQELMLHLRKLLLRRCTPSPKDRIHELQRKIARFFKPTGLFMVMLGPDGAGKSSVVEEMIPQISPAFRDIHYTHLRPRLGMKKENGTAVTDPHG